MANTGAKFIITEIKGEAYVRKETGETVKLNVGDLLEEGDVLLTGDGEVTLEDQAGAVLTIPADSTFILPGALPPVLSGSEGQETGGEEAGSEDLAPGEAASQSQAQTSQPQSSSGGEGGDASSGGGSSFFNAPRTDYLQDNRFVDQGNLNRDINDVFDFMGRHTENPRIHYQFDLDRVKFPLYGPDEYERGGGRRDDYTPPIEEHKEDRSDDVRFELAPDQNSVKEDGPLTASGSVLDNDRGRELKVVGVMKQGDPGSPSSGNVGNEVTGEYGTVKINADGSYTYELNNSDVRVQALAAGEKFTETFVYSATDKRGETQTTTLTITIHGTNDAPEIRLLDGDSDSAGLTETDEPLTASGTLTPYDVDTSDTVTAEKTDDLEIGGSFAGKLPEGFDAEKFLSMFEVGGPGEPSTTEQENPHGITWTFNSGDEAFNFLPAGETIILTYTVEATDSHGAKTTHPVTITITGTNDVPVAAPDAETISKNDPSVGGNVLVNDHDPDQGDEIKVVGVTKGKEDTAGGNVGAGVPGEYGTIIINEDGSYTYTPNGGDPRVSGLKDGEKVEDVFTYTVSDGKGGTSTTTVTITINGENNPPVARPDTGFTPRDEKAEGNVIDNDSDPEGDKITVTGIVSEKDPDGGLNKPVEGEYGKITIDEDGNYTYTPDPDNPAVKNMEEGETLKDTFTYTIVDEDGNTSTTTVTITIGGPGNHPPMAHPDENSVSEDGPSVQGNVITGGTPGDKADVDPDGDLLEVIGVAKGDTGTANGNVGSEVPGEYGRIIINPDGSYTYTPNSGDSRVNGLEDGEKLEDVFTYTISDGNGGTSTTTVTITINGVNDDPVARPDENTVGRGGADQAGYEDGNPDTTIIAGNVTVNDSDPEGKTLIVTGVGTEINPAGNVGAEVKGQYGTVIIHEDGSYTYILDNRNAAVEAMGEDDTLEDVFTYAISDGQGGADQTTLKIIITGTAVPNLPPVAEPDKGTVYEDGPPVEGNVLENDHDPEGDPIKVVGVEKGDGGTPVTDGSGVGTEVPGEYGKITIDEDGNYTYTPNSGDPRVNGLDEGETLEDTFTYTIVDEDGRTSTTTVTITITGTNDGPVALPDTNTVPEDGPAAVGNVLPNDSDPEGDPLTVVGVEKGNTGTQITDGSGVSGTGVTGQYGTVVIHPDGSYSYTPNREVTNSLADGEEVKDVFTYTISDGKGGYAHTTLTITITGTNDAPTANPDVNTVREGAPDHPDHEDNNPDTTIIVGNVTDNDTDPDIGDTLTVIGVQKGEHASPFTGATTVTGDYGEVTINPDGSYTYALDNTNLAVKALGKGETLTETFTYTVKDEQGATAFTTLTITIKGPLVIPDINEVTEDAADAAGHEDGLPETTIIAGDVIANDKGVGLEVTGVRAGDDAENPAVGNVSVEVQGTYGKVVINHDGTYTYALDNANEDVDALAVGETLTETFVYTASDGTETSNTTLTITIHGANDAPVIGCKTEEYGNKEEETIQDYSEDLVTGTLYVGDVDNNDVVTVDISKVVNTGYDLKFDETQLKGLFTFDNDTVLGKDDYFDQKGITWTFTSGGLNFIPDGQTATLVYTVTVTDKEGATASHDVTINITGNDDTGSLPHSLTKTIPEDQHNETPLSGDLFKEPGYEDDPDEGQTVRIKSYTIEGMGSQQGATGGFIVGTEHAVYTAGGKIGKITINADGTYYFYTEKDYSGELKINYEGESGSDEKGWTDITGRTLTIKVTPVADAPEIPVAPVETPEDTRVSLGLTVPVLKDQTDLTGGSDNHDNPERLGEITLSGFPAGAKLYNGGTELTLTGGSVTITITDIPGYHTSTASGAYQMTTDKYEALEVLPPADTHNNFSITVSATSYEVDDEGNILKDSEGHDISASNSATIKVEVLADTDKVTLNWDDEAELGDITNVIVNDSGFNSTFGENKTFNLVLKEDTPVNLKDLLTAGAFKDVDGSEARWFYIENNSNQAIKVGGVIVPENEGIKLSAGNDSDDFAKFPDILIQGGDHFSGVINGIKIYLVAQDEDSDSTLTGIYASSSTDLGAVADSSHAPIKSDVVTLNMTVLPVNGDVTLDDVTTPEDTPVALLKNLELVDDDGSESITKIVIKAIPDGWVLKNGAGAVVHNGNGSADYEIPPGDLANYKNYTITPPAHSSADWKNFAVEVTTKDTHDFGDGKVYTTGETTTTLKADVTVTPVPEKIGVDSDGNGGDDLFMVGNHIYATPAEEDTYFLLNEGTFSLKTDSEGNPTWFNADGSEKTYAVFTPQYKDGGGNWKNAVGSTFKYNNGSEDIEIQFAGVPVKIPVEYLHTVEYRAPENAAGEFKILVQAHTKDLGDDPWDTSVEFTSPQTSELTNLIVKPKADNVTLRVAQASGLEDTEIPLKITPYSGDPRETFVVTISGIPEGAVLRYNGQAVEVTGGSWTMEGFDSSKSLTITPPLNSNQDFNLTVKSHAVDVLVINGVTHTHTGEDTTLTYPVHVKGVADKANLTSNDYEIAENINDGNLNKIALKDAFEASLQDKEDGSETLSLIISGLGTGFSIEGGSFMGGGKWSVSQEAFDDGTAKLITPKNFSGTATFHVTAITTEDDGNFNDTVNANIAVKITPSPEATINTSASEKEDEWTKLKFNIEYQNGDNDETIEYVWINPTSKNAGDLEFTIGKGGTTPDTDTTPDSDTNGWYKIAKEDLGNVWVKGPANGSGDYKFDIKYRVQDSPEDGTLSAVTEDKTAEYTLHLSPVTDATETALSEFTALDANANATIPGEITVTGATSFTMKVTVSQLDDSDGQDVDGSEKLEYIIVDGVPPGVTIEGGFFLYNLPGTVEGTPTQRWIVPKDDSNLTFDQNTYDGKVEVTLKYTVDNSNGLFDWINNESITFPITVRAWSRDWFETESGDLEPSEAGWNLIIKDLGGPGGTQLTPAEVTVTADVKPTLEDAEGGVKLSDLAKFTIEEGVGHSPRFSITLRNVPEGVEVVNMMKTTSDGETVWTAYGQGDQDALDDLVKSISLKLPDHWNSNEGNPGHGLKFEIDITSYVPGGDKSTASVEDLAPVITPDTDDPVIDISATGGNEGVVSVPINIKLTNDADDPNSTIKGADGGKIYIKLEGPAHGTGELWYNGQELALENVSNVTDLTDGKYYVISGVSYGSDIELFYKPDTHTSGALQLTTYVVTQETGASEKLSSQTGSFSITPENSGYNMGDFNATGNENQAHVEGDGKIPLLLPEGHDLFDSDGSEEIVSVTLSGLPADYIVYIGNEMAQNVGGGAWSIKLTEDGKIPGNISILPKEYDSGTYNLSLNIFTKETERNDIEEDNVTITLKVDPVASGVRIDPTKTFGETGKPISLNLNAEMHDLDGSETMSLSLTGLPEVVTFNHGEASSSYDTDSDTWTWTITGIAHDVINDLTFTTATAFSGTVEVKAWTVEGNDSESEKVAGTFNVSVEDSGEPIGGYSLFGFNFGGFDSGEGEEGDGAVAASMAYGAPAPEGEGNEPFAYSGEEGESDGQGGSSAGYEPFLQSGESGSGGQEWGSSSPSLQDGEGASHGSDWDAASGNSGSGNSGDESHTSFHDGSSDLGAGSDVIPVGSGPETSSGGDSGPEGRGGLDDALEGISADDVLDTGSDELPLPGGDEGDGLGSVPDTGGADIPEFYAPDVPDSAARIAEEMEDALSA